ncbi:hypothetical protein Poli38472_006008 [Pythium oligandrum]|uniref:Kinesin-like protein n=1 Tax=Pythium oligandrum TaxID=41045 RepID=A0A8K1CTS9_PYTOL|nr:hypothetical protein Poli38472_006008 [Pythium oligandrum]|eukprot:TMW68540.1 hypothetical protein Poli38472_006008 [Pythium oligandrum]
MVLPSRPLTAAATVPETPDRAAFYQAGKGNILNHFAGLTSPDASKQKARANYGAQRTSLGNVLPMDMRVGHADATNQDMDDAMDNDDDSAARKLSRAEMLSIWRQTKQDAEAVKKTRTGSMGASGPPPRTNGSARSKTGSTVSFGTPFVRESMDEHTNQRENADMDASAASSTSQMFTLSFSPPKHQSSKRKKEVPRLSHSTAVSEERRMGASSASSRDSASMVTDTSFKSDNYSLVASMNFISRDLEEEERANKSKSDKERAYLYKKRYMDVYGFAAGLSRRVIELEQFKSSKEQEIQVLRDAINQQGRALDMVTNNEHSDEQSNDQKVQSLCREIGILARQLNERDTYIDSLQNEREESVRTLNELKLSHAALQSSSGDVKSKTQSSSTVNDAEIAELREQLARVERDRDAAIEEASSTRKKFTESQQRSEFAETERRLLQQSIAEMEKQLEAVHDQWVKEKDSLSASLVDNKKRMNADSEKLRQENAQLKKSVQQHTESERKLRLSLDAAQRAGDDLKKQIARLQAQLKESQTKIESFGPKEAELQQMVNLLNTTQERLTTATAENKDLRRNLTAKTRELEESKSHFQERTSQLESRIYQAEIVRRSLHNKVMELKGNIRVFCRVRPVLNHERKSNGNEEIFNFPDYHGERRQIELIAGPRSHVGYGQNGSRDAVKKYPFDFDLVFDGSCNQEDVFLEVSALVQSALDGYDVCIFAYGQTGSGKTYTMQGVTQYENLVPSSHMGIVGRAIAHIYSTIEDLKTSGWEFNVNLEMIEIYNETLRDLLAPPGSTDKVDLRMDAEGKPTVMNSCVHPIEDEHAALKLLQKALGRRATKTTNMNDRSSRSHCVISFRLDGENSLNGERRSSVVHLVDLAGSERLSKSGSGQDKDLLKEAQAINKSLSSLGNVICALAKKSAHVPFRDSKLTHFLSPSLGGDSKTLMICNLSPLALHRDETLNSLRFAKTVNSCEIAYPSYGSRS